MPEGNVEIVRRMYEGIERGDVEMALSPFAPDVEFDVSHDVWGHLTGGGLYHGLEGLMTWWGDLSGAWEDGMEIRCDELIDIDDQRVVSVATMRGRGRTSGLPVEHRHAGVWTLRDAKVVRVTWFSSRAEALEAAGLSE